MSTLWDHPDYIKSQEDLILYRDLYDGDHKTMTQPKYLWPYDIETSTAGRVAKLFSGRQQRSRYTNITRMLVDIWNGLLFRRDISIPEDVRRMLGEEEFQDIDGDGNSLESFIRDKMSVSDLVYGDCITFVDSFASDAITEAQASAEGQRPFLKLINPLDFRDWEREVRLGSRLNKFNFARFEFFEIPARVDVSEEPKLVRYSKALIRTPQGEYLQRLYRQVSEEELKRAPELQKVLTKNTHGEFWMLEAEAEIQGIEELPIVVSRGESWLKATSQIALRYHNVESALDNVNYYSAFPIKYFTGVESEEAKIALSAYTALFLPDGSSAGMLEPNEPVALQKRLLDTLDVFFKIGFKQSRQLAADSRAAQGADSRREERDNLIAIVQARQERLENAINKSLQIYAQFKGQDNFNSEIKLSHAITEQELESLQALYLTVKADLDQYGLEETKRQFLRAIVARAELPDPSKSEQEILGGSFARPSSQTTSLARLIELQADGG